MYGMFKKLVQIATDDGMWPNARWLAWAKEHTQYSPDLANMEEYEYQLLFVYDDTMTRHRKHLLLEDCEMLCQAFTNDPFTVYKKNLGKVSFPIALKAKDARHVNTFGAQSGLAPLAKVKGELYKVRASRINILDNGKRNGVEYRRRKVKLIVPYREAVWLKDPRTEEKLWATKLDSGQCMTYHEIEVEAWMYVGKQSYWDHFVYHGYYFSPVKTFKLKDDVSYSYFSLKELNVEVSTE